MRSLPCRSGGGRGPRRLPRCRWPSSPTPPQDSEGRREAALTHFGKAAPRIRAQHDAHERSGGEDGRMEIEHTTRLCTLERAVGRLELCPKGACPFWEPGGAALGGRCAFEQLCPKGACPFWEPGGAALGGRCAFEQLDVAADAPLATWLLEIRERLASAESTAAADEAHSLF